MSQLQSSVLSTFVVPTRIIVDYAGPFYMKYGHLRKPTVVKTYASVFVSLSVKAVHLELVSELTTGAFLACLRHLISQQGKPRQILWVQLRRSKSFIAFLKKQSSQYVISEFCSTQNIQ